MKHILIVVFLLSSNSLFAQVDSIFWFAVPEISASGGSQQLDRPIFLRISSMSESAQVTISQPANPSFKPIQLTLAANSTQSLDVTAYIEQIESKPRNTILNKGLKISSSALINVYYEVFGGQNNAYNPEIFVLKGANALGTYFVIPSQSLVSNDNRYTPMPTNGFDIVASEPATVTIQTSKPANGRSAITPFTISLKTGESFSVTADSHIASMHLAGSTVQSTGKIAITVKDDLMYGGPVFGGGCADLGGDQITPTTLLGNEYIAIKGFLDNPGDQFFVTALEDATQISVNGIFRGTINAFETMQIPFGANEAIYVTANKRIANMHLSGFGCETGLESLPPINCTGSKTVSVVRATNEPLFLLVVCQASAVSGFSLNGNNSILPASIFQSVPGTSDQWKFAKVSIDLGTVPANGIAKVTNNTGRFQLGIIHGTREFTGCRYGYFSDFNAVDIKVASAKKRLCIGDTLKLSYNSSAFGTPNWNGPNNFTSSTDAPFKLITTLKDSGYYRIQINDPECGLVEDSVLIAVDSIAVTTVPDAEICMKDSIQLGASVFGSATFKWMPATDISNPLIANPKVSPKITTRYIVEATFNNNCKAYDTVWVRVRDTPLITTSADTTLCNGLPVQLLASGGITYEWSPATYLNNSNISNPVAKPLQDISYAVKATDSYRCQSSKTIKLTVFPKPIASIKPDTAVCGIQTINLSAGGGTDYLWSPGISLSDSLSAAPSVTISTTQLFTVRIINKDCLDTSYKTTTITVNTIPTVTASSSNDIDCTTPTANLNAAGASQYTWQPNIWLSNNLIASPVARPDSTVTYLVTGQSTNGCIDTAKVTVKVNFTENTPKVMLPNAFTPNGDGLNDCFGLPTMSGSALAIEYFEIFNRWGEIVWKADNNNSCWDGTHKGQKMQGGYYPYRIKAKGNCGEIIKNGWIILIR